MGDGFQSAATSAGSVLIAVFQSSAFRSAADGTGFGRGAGGGIPAMSCCTAGGYGLAAATSAQTEQHAESQKHSECFLHFISLSFREIRMCAKKRKRRLLPHKLKTEDTVWAILEQAEKKQSLRNTIPLIKDICQQDKIYDP